MKDALYTTLFRRLMLPSDIAGHLALLSFLAENSLAIVEFGVRGGHSTRAFLNGLAHNHGTLYSYDINPDCARALEDTAIPDNVTWLFEAADTSKLETIPECDLLFIDTLHTKAQVQAELQHHQRVIQMIVLHDTELFGVDGEQGQTGIMPAVENFVQTRPWMILRHFPHCNGLTILARQ